MDAKLKDLSQLYSYIKIKTADEDNICKQLDKQQIPYNVNWPDMFALQESVKLSIHNLLVNDSNTKWSKLSESLQRKIYDLMYGDINSEAFIHMTDYIYTNSIQKINDIIEKEVNDFCKNDDRYNDLLADYIKEAEKK